MESKNNEQYFEAILNNLSGGLISVDLGGNLVYANPMAYKILHLESDPSFIGKNYSKVFLDFEALVGVIGETMKTGAVKRRAEIRIMHANTPLIIGYSTIMVKDEKGENMGVAVIFQDISFMSENSKAKGGRNHK